VMEKLTDTQIIFLLSKANGGTYLGEHLPATQWQFPKDTWFQKRLEELKEAGE
jgi:hypothetical protein